MLTRYFWDIESLSDLFSLALYQADKNHIELYYLSDQGITLTDTTTDLIHRRNKNFSGTVSYHDLTTKAANELLFTRFGVYAEKGLRINAAYKYMDLHDTPTSMQTNAHSYYPLKYRPLCTTDPDYEEATTPYFFGYNSYNYDTTMLALYFYEALTMQNDDTTFKINPPKASLMREYNDELFKPSWIDRMPHYLANLKPGELNWNSAPRRIRAAWLATGRMLDVAKLNEKQSRVGLKRLLGQLGHQILEADLSDEATSLSAHDIDELVAYNVSDVINLEKLLDHDYYQSQFELKRNLLATYPELIYEKKRGSYEPDIRPEAVRKDRLSIDSTSAQFATNVLCPYGHISDIKGVSFDYPHPEEAKRFDIQPVNVLEDTKRYVDTHIKSAEARSEFQQVYEYYKSIEGRNFNRSENYQNDYPSETEEPMRIYEMPRNPNTMPYYHADGSPTDSYVKFTYGGIHGAQYNRAYYESEKEFYERSKADMEKVQAFVAPLHEPEDQGDTGAAALKRAKEITIDGEIYQAKDFLKSGSTQKRGFFKNVDRLNKKLFIDDSGKTGWTQLNPRYTQTSADIVNYGDFDSYYPNLLYMMRAFFNPALGYDRTKELLEQKAEFGKKMKDPAYPPEQRAKYKLDREGVKLVLNASSGAGDTNFPSSININNTIISMRIIGQLLTYRIGLEQALEGAEIPSTNTDGLHTIFDPQTTSEKLSEAARRINVPIEAEPLFLISKDANNRLEATVDGSVILSASGGSLACYKDTNPTQSINAPAIIDWALSHYLMKVAHPARTRDDLDLTSLFDRELAEQIMRTAPQAFEDDAHFLRMFQHIISASRAKMTYNYAIEEDGTITPLSHYNRIFLVKPDTPHAQTLRSVTARVITDATQKKRERNKEAARQHDAQALSIFAHFNIQPADIPQDREATFKKITNVEEDWRVLVINDDLFHLDPKTVAFLKESLDISVYLDMLEKTYTNNWRNV